MRILGRALAVIAAVVVGVPVALYVGHGIAGSIEQRDLDERAEAALAAGLPGAERAVREQRTRTLHGRATPAYSWTEVACGLESQEAGWIVESYAQVCTVRAVDLIVSSDPPGTCRNDWAGAGPAVSCDGIIGQDRWRVLLSGQRPGAAVQAHGWRVVVTTAEASDFGLGCSPWGLIFCDSPLDEPAMDVPALRRSGPATP